MRVVSLHADVLIATSAIWQTNCVMLRGSASEAGGTEGAEGGGAGETFLIDSPVLPEEIDALPAVIEQAGFPQPAGLLATHGDWDHLLARLAFPQAAFGCAASTAERLEARPGEAQRELRAFDEQHYFVRSSPLALGSVQALDIPGGCEIGAHELALHPADGHTCDGMAVWAPWAGVLVAGDYLSAVEIPVLGCGGSADAYAATLERLGPLVARARFVVPGHGPVLDSGRAMAVLAEDLAYSQALRAGARRIELPEGRRGDAQRTIHAENVARAA